MSGAFASDAGRSVSAVAMSGMADRDALVRTIEALERQRETLGQPVVDLALAPIRARLAVIDAGDPSVPAGRSGERKVVTVLFVDVAGFTEMSERVGSEASLEMVNGLFDRLVPVIERYGGSVDKFIGDEVMAVFGAPRSVEHHAEHALRAALGMFTALTDYNRESGLELALHVGANTGSVIAGAVGSHTRHDYSVTGDTVNVAARLEAAAHAGQILVGPSTFRHTFQLFEFEPLAPLSLKGKLRAVPAYRLIGAAPRRARTRIEGLELPFTGRAAELDVLVTRARSDVQCRRGAIIVRAEPGIGKSRLVAEFRDRVGIDVRWLEASGEAYRSDVSYGVVSDLLDALVGVPESVERQEAAAAYTDYLDGIGSERARDAAPYLFRLRGLPLSPVDEQALAAIEPDTLRQRMTNAVTELLIAATADRPSVVCIEDLHWGDPSSVALIRALAENKALTQVQFMLTTRPCAGSEWIDKCAAEADRWQVIDLAPLSEADSRMLLDRAFAAGDAGALGDEISAKAQGNPLYLVSFLRSLVDEGVAILQVGRLAMTRPVSELAIPDGLHAVVGSRIDALPAPAKRVLQWGSIMGSVFSPEDVLRIAEAEGVSTRIDDVVSLLCERQLLQTDADGRLRFVHALVRDVAYEQMLERDRRRLHAIVARSIEQQVFEAVEAPESDIALLAWHHERAGERARASARYEQAATLASRSHANREELRYLESALRLAEAGNRGRLADLRERAGDALQLIGRYEEAAARFESVFAGTEAPPAIATARLHRKIARTWTARIVAEEANHSVDEARRWLAAASECATDAWWREHFAVELFAMWALYMQGRTDGIAEIAASLGPEIDEYATIKERGQFHRNVGLLRLRQQRYRPDAATVELTALAADEVRESKDTAELCLTTFTYAFAQVLAGAVEEADRAMRQVLEETVRLGDAERNLLCFVYLAVTSRQLDNVDSAEAFAKAAISRARANRSPHYEAVSQGTLAWVAWRRGDAALADHLVELAQQATIPLYPFAWIYAAVGLARAVERSDIQAATMMVARMLEPSHQRLDTDVQAVFEAALEAPGTATMQAVVDTCRRVRYL